MIYEFRVYKLHAGKLEAFKNRFSKINIPLFERHRIKFLVSGGLGYAI